MVLLLRYAIPGIFFLVALGFQVSGIENPTLAKLLWTVAILWGVVAILSLIPWQRFLARIPFEIRRKIASSGVVINPPHKGPASWTPSDEHRSWNVTIQLNLKEGVPEESAPDQIFEAELQVEDISRGTGIHTVKGWLYGQPLSYTILRPGARGALSLAIIAKEAATGVVWVPDGNQNGQATNVSRLRPASTYHIRLLVYQDRSSRVLAEASYYARKLNEYDGFELVEITR